MRSTLNIPLTLFLAEASPAVTFKVLHFFVCPHLLALEYLGRGNGESIVFPCFVILCDGTNNKRLQFRISYSAETV